MVKCINFFSDKKPKTKDLPGWSSFRKIFFLNNDETGQGEYDFLENIYTIIDYCMQSNVINT